MARKPGWYVVQVETGREDYMCALILRFSSERDLVEGDGAVDAPLLEECFSPRFKTRRKRAGEWFDTERMLLPGYVICVTQDPDGLRRALYTVPKFARMIVPGETFVSLREEDRAWIEEWTHKGDRTVPLSIAYKEGDMVVVTEGPLKGHEGMITKVNRRKCLAFLELHVGGKKIATTVGLAIVPTSKRQNEANAGVEQDAKREQDAKCEPDAGVEREAAADDPDGV